MILTDTGGTAFTPCPAGSYLARCIQLIDLGTQTTTYEGETKHAKKVLVAWEILDDECRREDGQPFILSKRFTQSLHEKSALRKTLSAWRGRDFTPLELRGFDLKNVLGQNAFLSVIHADKDGKTFANIAGCMKPPKGMTAPMPGTEPLVHWSMSDPDWQVFAQLPQRLVDQISASPEFQALNKPASVVLPAPAAAPTPAPTARATAPAPKPQAPAAPNTGSGFDSMDDDIPF